MEFAFSLNRVVDDFNQSLIEFDLILRVGKYTHTHTHKRKNFVNKNFYIIQGVSSEISFI